MLHLQTHDAAPYRDVILYACTHNITYDRQIEGGKTLYVWDILELSGEKEYFRRKTLDALAAVTNEDDRDYAQKLEMTFRFAEAGDQEARQLLYDHFIKRLSRLKSDSSFDDDPAELIIQLDKLEGFLFVVNTLVEKVINNPDCTDDDRALCCDDFLIRILAEQIGKDQTDTFLAETRQQNTQLDIYLKAIEKYSNYDRQPKLYELQELSYAEVKQLIASKTHLNLRKWGELASKEDLTEAANDLLQENDEKRIRQYLYIFFKTSFPLDPELLFKLIEHPGERIWAMTFTVLEQISHPAVREFALKRIRENKNPGRAVGLLMRNFKEGDWAIIEEVTRRELEEWDHHSLQMDVWRIFEKSPSKDAAQALINLYEYAPCSNCRLHIVQQLHFIHTLPDHIRQECLYDSNDDIRELAQNNFVRPDEM